MSAGEAARRLAYGAAELVTARRGVPRVVDGERLRLAPRWARYYPPVYDPPKAAFLREVCRLGTTAFDVGAHLGLYAVLMARVVGETGRVHAFEPTPGTVDALRRTLALNRVDGVVTVHPVAAGAAPGSLPFHDTGDALSNANSLVPGVRTRASFEVPVTTIDDIAAGAEVSCIKIDVEGGEVAVLRGAAATIERCQPAIALEVHPAVIGADGTRTIWQLAADAGYAVTIAGLTVDEDHLLARPAGYELELRPSEGPA